MHPGPPWPVRTTTHGRPFHAHRRALPVTDMPNSTIASAAWRWRRISTIFKSKAAMRHKGRAVAKRLLARARAWRALGVSGLHRYIQQGRDQTVVEGEPAGARKRFDHGQHPRDQGAAGFHGLRRSRRHRRMSPRIKIRASKGYAPAPRCALRKAEGGRRKAEGGRRKAEGGRRAVKHAIPNDRYAV